MSESFDDRLARIGAEAEAGEEDQTDRPLPEGTAVSRPGRSRSKVLQVRLNDDEYAAIETIAARRELPVSTVAREQLLKLVAQAQARESGSLFVVVTELVETVNKLQESIAAQQGGPLIPTIT